MNSCWIKLAGWFLRNAFRYVGLMRKMLEFESFKLLATLIFFHFPYSKYRKNHVVNILLNVEGIALSFFTRSFSVIAQSNVDDVRTVLDNYRDEEDPVAAFRRRQELLQETLLERQKNQQQMPSGGGFFSRGLFGSRVSIKN